MFTWKHFCYHEKYVSGLLDTFSMVFIRARPRPGPSRKVFEDKRAGLGQVVPEGFEQRAEFSSVRDGSRKTGPQKRPGLNH